MNNIQWTEPRPLRQRVNAIPFPVNALPSVLRDMAQAISVTTSTDVGMAGTAMLSAVGYCFTGLYRLAGKADHTEPPVLYSLIIAQPSERKSPVMHFIKAPFDSFESKYNKDHLEEMYTAQQEVKALEARVKAMEKEDEPDTSAIAKLRVQAENIRNTAPVRIAVDDITPESLASELSENDSLLMISDEAGMLSNFNGKYSNGIPNLDLLLKAWNGEKYICNRVIRGRMEIPRPYLSVALAGQPYIWDNMMNDTAFRSSGLIARFVPCFAKSDVGKRRYDTAPIPQEVRARYHSLIHQLLKSKKNHGDEETILRLSREASEEYIGYCNNYIEKEIKESMCCCQDWGGKFHGLILRIACILHCADCCSRGVEPSEENVNHDTLEEMLDAIEGKAHRCVYDGLNVVPDEQGNFCYVPTTHKVTLGEIVDLLESFKAQPNTLVMPEIPHNSFAKKLYSTYLSYLPKEKTIFDLKMKCDDRGSFTELLKTTNGGQFSVNISKPGITKGQHWHNTKWEFFIVVAGHGLIQERKIGTDEVIEFEVAGDKIQAVHMLPGDTHNIINLSNTENLVTVMWANEQFDPQHPDTFFEVVK